MTLSPYGRRALNAEALRVRKAGVGTRHNTLRSSAYSIGQLIPDHVSEALARVVLIEAGMVCAAATRGADPIPHDEIERTIESALQAGQLNPRQVAIGFTNRRDAMQSLDEIAQAWDGTPLGGWEGRRCHAVMPAILKIAREIGGPKKVPLPMTRLAVNSGSGRGTCAKALKDLQDLGWLTLNTPGGPARSARYDIHLPPSSTSRSRADTTHTRPHMWQRPEDAIIGHDAGRSGCVGPTGLRILKWMSDRPGFHRQTAVAKGLGISPGTVGRYVRASSFLVSVGIVERDHRASVSAVHSLSLPLLDLMALRSGTLGSRDRHRRRLAAYFQREGYLDSDLHWLDPATGQRRARADWLMPERPIDRIRGWVGDEPSVRTERTAMDLQPRLSGSGP